MMNGLNFSLLFLLVTFFTAFFTAFFCFGLIGNLIVPYYLKQKYFSREWWLYVFIMTFLLMLCLVIFLAEQKEGTTSDIRGENIIWVSILLFSATYYIKNKSVKNILFWLSGLSLLLIALYNILFLHFFTFQVISGILLGILILIYGPTGKLDKILEKYKKRHQAKKENKRPSDNSSSGCSKLLY
jgi:hypothetical protein